MSDVAEAPVGQSGAVQLSDRAAARVAALAVQENQPNARLRITVSGGGCSGFQYGFAFDDQVNDDDRVFTNGPAGLVVDETSLELLAGSEVDFVEDLIGASFQIRNPNAKSSCGCGNSFAV